MKYTFRRAVARDIPALQMLMDELNNFRAQQYDESTEEFHQRVEPYDKLSSNDLNNDIILVAEVDNVIHGYIWGSVHKRRRHRLSKLGYIEELYLSEGARGEGVSTLLLDALVEAFKAQGCNHMTTHTDWENTGARNFYERCGMSPVTVEYWKGI